MSTSQSQKKEAIAQAAEQELTSLAIRGVRIAGNACSPIVLVKGDLDEAERLGGELAAGPDGAALRKALGAIGYAPEDFCVLASVAGAGDGAVAVGETLPCELFREALEALDPEAAPENMTGSHIRFLFGLASDGVYMAFSVTRETVVSYTAFPPLPGKTWRYLSVALSLESPPPDVIRHPALRSPDFPHLAPFGPASRDYISYFVKNGTSDS